MKAGTDLDNLVAEKVMGWYRKDYRETGFAKQLERQGKSLHPDWRPAQEYWYCLENGKDERKASLSWSPSTDIAAAWQVVDRMKDQYTFMLSYRQHDGDYFVCFDPVNRYEEIADTAPLAICLAALKAVGVEVES